MKTLSRPIFIAFVLIFGALQALQSQNASQRNILQVLSTPDSISNASVRIYQDKRIEQLLNAKRATNTKQLTVSGYRVQVFSSNVQRTAKSEAFQIEKQILNEYPAESVYVNYVSPFWKVRVGDFKTRAEAQSFRIQLIGSFPKLRNEIYVVREQISIPSVK